MILLTLVIWRTRYTRTSSLLNPILLSLGVRGFRISSMVRHVLLSTTVPSINVIFDFQHMYISKRGDTVGLSQLTLGCVTDFRPILGNPVEVAHMTSPGTVYISHTKGTYFPLARISSSIPL